MFNKSKIYSIGLYDENFIYAQDYKLISDIYKNKLKVKYLFKTLYETRETKVSIQNIRKNEQKEFANMIKIDNKTIKISFFN